MKMKSTDSEEAKTDIENIYEQLEKHKAKRDKGNCSDLLPKGDRRPVQCLGNFAVHPKAHERIGVFRCDPEILTPGLYFTRDRVKFRSIRSINVNNCHK
jgi:hypothetical protein